ACCSCAALRSHKTHPHRRIGSRSAPPAKAQARTTNGNAVAEPVRRSVYRSVHLQRKRVIDGDPLQVGEPPENWPSTRTVDHPHACGGAYGGRAKMRGSEDDAATR